MTDYEKLWSFNNLYKAHRKARLGKRSKNEVIQFEMNLSTNLVKLSDAIRTETYQMSGYHSFQIYDPKKRTIHALHYVDRVVQHCLCDEILAPLLDPRMIYDNAACRVGKGTHFAVDRVVTFLREHYKSYGAQGYVLKCDIRKYFDSIDHTILKEKLKRIICDDKVLRLLEMIIDSYQTTPGKGLPLGNQTSQWFAIFYLDGFDRLIKERLHIRYYSRYMDDCVLIHHDKAYLQACLKTMTSFVTENLQLEFNNKTQIFPLCNGVQYLGWHLYLSDTGKVIRRVSTVTKKRYRARLKKMRYEYAHDLIEFPDIKVVLNSYNAHFAHGHTNKMQRRAHKGFVLTKAKICRPAEFT